MLTHNFSLLRVPHSSVPSGQFALFKEVGPCDFTVCQGHVQTGSMAGEELVDQDAIIAMLRPSFLELGHGLHRVANKGRLSFLVWSQVSGLQDCLTSRVCKTDLQSITVLQCKLFHSRKCLNQLTAMQDVVGLLVFCFLQWQHKILLCKKWAVATLHLGLRRVEWHCAHLPLARTIHWQKLPSFKGLKWKATESFHCLCRLIPVCLWLLRGGIQTMCPWRNGQVRRDNFGLEVWM